MGGTVKEVVLGLLNTGLAISDLNLAKGVITGIGRVGTQAFTTKGVMKVFVGDGKPWHVWWQTTKTTEKTLTIEARGRFGQGMMSVQAASTERVGELLNFCYNSRTWVFKAPVASEALASVSNAFGKTPQAVSCVTAALTAFSRGNFHVPAYLVNHGAVNVIETVTNAVSSAGGFVENARVQLQASLTQKSEMPVPQLPTTVVTPERVYEVPGSGTAPTPGYTPPMLIPNPAAEKALSDALKKQQQQTPPK